MAERDKLLRVPVGSKLAGFVDDVRGRKPPKLVIDGKETEFGTVSKGKFQVEQAIGEGKEIVLQARGDQQARWKLHIIPDLAPTIEFVRPIGVDKWSTKIEYIAGDDFGVTGVQLQIRLHGSALGADMLSSDEEPEVLRIDLPVPAGAKKVADSYVRDLTSSPWAGLKVTVMLFATDALGQKGRSAVETFLLPERVFNDPTARALIVLRKALTRDPRALRIDVADGMRMIQARPESYRDDAVVALGLRIGASRLVASTGDKQAITDTQQLLWDLAMRLEQGATSDAEKQLEQARQNLRDAIQRNAGDEEIEKLIQQLYDAMDRWQKEMAERMKDPEERRRMEEQAQRMDPNNTMTQDDLQKMLDKIREMAKNGQREEAKKLLEELRKMMENATPMMGQNGQQRQQGRQQQGQQGQGNQQGREMMNQLDRLSRRQNQLLGESERQGRQQQGQQGQRGQQGQQGQRGQQGQQGQGQQPGQGDGQWGEGQGQQQGQLRNQLGDFMRKLDENGMGMPDALGRAERNMREAEDALRRGDAREASRAQRRALDNLQQGMGDMAEQMRNRGPGNGQDIAEIEERERRSEDRDPLGRSDGNFGDAVDTGQDKVPLELERQRSREILDELRRRAGEQARPRDELEYIERLLKTY
jgi:uncharacterized protein (TIGR02302 family)